MSSTGLRTAVVGGTRNPGDNPLVNPASIANAASSTHDGIRSGSIASNSTAAALDSICRVPAARRRQRFPEVVPNQDVDLEVGGIVDSKVERVGRERFFTHAPPVADRAKRVVFENPRQDATPVALPDFEFRLEYGIHRVAPLGVLGLLFVETFGP